MSEEHEVSYRDRDMDKPGEDQPIKLIDSSDILAWTTYLDRRTTQHPLVQDAESEFRNYIKSCGFGELVQYIESVIFPELIKNDLMTRSIEERRLKIIEAKRASVLQLKEPLTKGFRIFSFPSLWKAKDVDNDTSSSASSTSVPPSSHEEAARTPSRITSVIGVSETDGSSSLINLLYRFISSRRPYDDKTTPIISAISGTVIKTDTLITLLFDIFTTKYGQGLTLTLLNSNHDGIPSNHLDNTTSNSHVPIFEYSGPKLISKHLAIRNFWSMFGDILSIVQKSSGLENLDHVVHTAIKTFYAHSGGDLKTNTPLLLHLYNIDTFTDACENQIISSFLKEHNISFEWTPTFLNEREDGGLFDDLDTTPKSKDYNSPHAMNASSISTSPTLMDIDNNQNSGNRRYLDTTTLLDSYKNHTHGKLKTTEDALIVIMRSVLSSIKELHESYNRSLRRIINLRECAATSHEAVLDDDEEDLPPLIYLLIFSSGGVAYNYSKTQLKDNPRFTPVNHVGGQMSYEFREEIFQLLGGVRNNNVVRRTSKIVYIHPPSESARRVMFMRALKEALVSPTYKSAIDIMESSLTIIKNAINKLYLIDSTTSDAQKRIMFNKQVLLSPMSSFGLLLAHTHHKINNNNVEGGDASFPPPLSAEKRIDKLVSLLAKNSRYASEDTITARTITLLYKYIWAIIPALGELAEIASILVNNASLASASDITDNVNIIVERLNNIPDLEVFISSISVVIQERLNPQATNNGGGSNGWNTYRPRALESYVFDTENEFKKQTEICMTLESMLSKKVMIDADYDEYIKDKLIEQSKKRLREDLSKDFMYSDPNKKQKTCSDPLITEEGKGNTHFNFQ